MTAAVERVRVRAWRVVARLDDFLWFASYEWGSNNETAPVLHGYALSFAMSGTERVLSLGGVPNYADDLAPLDIYCTPARLIPGGPRQRTVITFNSVDGPTLLTQALAIGEKVNDPKFGKRQVLVPGLRFELVAFTRRGFELPRVFRLGKKRSPVVREQAVELTGRRFHADDETTPFHAINPLDVSGDVTRCLVRSIPPHLIYEWASIRADEFIRDGNLVVHVPARVRSWQSE
jgi:CRISPR type I-D-associated protein Csc1